MVCVCCSKDMGGPEGRAVCHECAEKVLNGAPRPASVSRMDFLRDATPVAVIVDGVPLDAKPREFNTGSLGWWTGGKVNVQVGQRPVRCQVTCSITVIGSKKEVKA